MIKFVDALINIRNQLCTTLNDQNSLLYGISEYVVEPENATVSQILGFSKRTFTSVDGLFAVTISQDSENDRTLKFETSYDESIDDTRQKVDVTLINLDHDIDSTDQLLSTVFIKDPEAISALGPLDVQSLLNNVGQGETLNELCAKCNDIVLNYGTINADQVNNILQNMPFNNNESISQFMDIINGFKGEITNIQWAAIMKNMLAGVKKGADDGSLVLNTSREGTIQAFVSTAVEAFFPLISNVLTIVSTIISPVLGTLIGLLSSTFSALSARVDDSTEWKCEYDSNWECVSLPIQATTIPDSEITSISFNGITFDEDSGVLYSNSLSESSLIFIRSGVEDNLKKNVYCNTYLNMGYDLEKVIELIYSKIPHNTIEDSWIQTWRAGSEGIFDSARIRMPFDVNPFSQEEWEATRFSREELVTNIADTAFMDKVATASLIIYFLEHITSIPFSPFPLRAVDTELQLTLLEDDAFYKSGWSDAWSDTKKMYYISTVLSWHLARRWWYENNPSSGMAYLAVRAADLTQIFLYLRDKFNSNDGAGTSVGFGTININELGPNTPVCQFITPREHFGQAAGFNCSLFLNPAIEGLLSPDPLSRYNAYYITEFKGELDNMPTNIMFNLPKIDALTLRRSLIITGVLLTATALVMTVVSRSIRKRRFIRQQKKVAKLNSMAAAVKANPTDENLSSLYKATAKYNFQAKLFGWGSYDPLNGWYNDSGTSSANESIQSLSKLSSETGFSDIIKLIK